MARSSTPPPGRRRWSRWLALAAVAFLALWLTFLDSHSIAKRVRWHQEHARLTRENEGLREKISDLEGKLETPPSDTLLERIAREEYGMRRAGETVYRIEKE